MQLIRELFLRLTDPLPLSAVPHRLGFLNPQPPKGFMSITAEEIMTAPAVGFHPVERASYVPRPPQTLRSDDALATQK
jgi:hypothetical protein